MLCLFHEQGLELDDFVSGPRELLLKLVEEHYPLPDRPDTGPGILEFYLSSFFFFMIIYFNFWVLLFCMLWVYFSLNLVIADDRVKELQRKRHVATPGVSFKGRVRKVAKWKVASDGESDVESESEFLLSLILESYYYVALF